jgi:thiamine phosphate synthase YjbQ (UPF0047 family)
LKSHTVYRTFRTEQRREFVRITEDVAEAVREAEIEEGMVLVAAMHITAAVWINDDEPGIQADALEWLDKLAPPSWKDPANEVARELLPDPGDYRHHRGGEDNGDAHLKNLLVHHQVIVPVTEGQLDLGPWQQIFYCEFDGQRSKRLVIKVMGEERWSRRGCSRTARSRTGSPSSQAAARTSAKRRRRSSRGAEHRSRS